MSKIKNMDNMLNGAIIFNQNISIWNLTKIESAKDMLQKHPTRLIEKAVKGMLPKNKLGRLINKNLYVYSGENHDQIAQKPKLVNLDDIK